MAEVLVGRRIRSTRSPRWAVALAMAGMLVGAACTSSGGAPPAASPLEEVRDSLRQRARHLLDGNVEGYLRDVGPAARSFHELIARGAQDVPLASIDLVFNPPPNVSANSAEFHDVPVRFVFTYTGVPADNKLSFTVLASFERHGPSWVETASAAAGVLPLWATGPVEATRSPHFLSLYRPGLAGAARAIALAEEGRSRLLPRLTVVIDEVHVMTLTADAKELGSLLPSATDDLPLAFAHAYGATGSFPVDRHMVVDTERVLRAGTTKSEDGLDLLPREVFQHELGHLALSRYHSASLPGWVAEGAAMYLSEERRLAEWRHPDFQQRIEGVSIDRLGGVEGLPGGLYPYANAAVLHLVDKAGAKAFWDFYRSFIDLGAGPGPSAPNTDALLRKFLAIDAEELDTATRAYIAGAVSGG